MNKYVNLALWILSFQVISGLIGWSMKVPLDGWYLTLQKSPLTPPGYVFGIVWPILYCLLAIAGWLIWQMKDSKATQSLKKVYMAQMLANWSWTPIYFSMRLMNISTLVIALMIVLTVYMMHLACKKERIITYLLLPYLAWISFAFYLNSYTWMYN